MTAGVSEHEVGSPDTAGPRKRVLTALGWAVGAAIVVLMAVYAQRGLAPGTPGVDRIANPAVHGAPRPVTYLLGWPHWLGLMQWLTVAQMVALVGAVTWYWRKYPRHPYLLMAIAATAVVWMDPIMNWAPFAVYNPQLWHLPVNWPLASVSPTIEPFIVIGYASFYAGPFFPANSLLRKLQARREDSFAVRHPLWTLSILIFVVGFVYDAILEIFCIRAGLYMYDQVVPFGSIWNGTPFQFPLLVEPAFVTIMMIPAGLLLYSARNAGGADAPGRGGVALTNAERLTRRLRLLPRRPALGTFIVMFGLLIIAYCGYGGAFAILKDTGASTSVACPWQYPEAKIYDPLGYYAKTGNCVHPATGSASHG
ncbi:MAG: spirocyclase AveC family protein [Streptosporangiales bacterium]|nr:spirocyclase AveC family protein [Streptosporangiales bacterium]